MFLNSYKFVSLTQNQQNLRSYYVNIDNVSPMMVINAEISRKALMIGSIMPAFESLVGGVAGRTPPWNIFLVPW